MILFVVDALLLRVVVVVVALFPKPKLVLMLLLGRGLMPPRGRPPLLLLLIVVVEHDFAFARDYCFVIITSCCCFLCIAKVMPMARIQVNINNRNVV